MGALGGHGQLDILHWEKDAWHGAAESLNSETDILLFPFDSAANVNSFDWRKHPLEEKDTEDRYRIVVVEASWNYGQTIARQIMDHRASKGLAPIRCVKLNDIVGRYWRFHEKGHSAVSTVECIVHTAMAAWLNRKEAVIADEHLRTWTSDLLLLFRLQRFRVLKSVDEPGRKCPRAMAVQGTGPTSWANVDVFDESTGEHTSNIII